MEIEKIGKRDDEDKRTVTVGVKGTAGRLIKNVRGEERGEQLLTGQRQTITNYNLN